MGKIQMDGSKANRGARRAQQGSEVFRPINVATLAELAELQGEQSETPAITFNDETLIEISRWQREAAAEVRQRIAGEQGSDT